MDAFLAEHDAYACVYVRISSQAIFVSWLELAEVPKEFADVGQGVRIVWYCIIGSTHGKTEKNKKAQWETPLYWLQRHETMSKSKLLNETEAAISDSSFPTLHHHKQHYLFDIHISGSVELKTYGDRRILKTETCYDDRWLIYKIYVNF